MMRIKVRQGMRFDIVKERTTKARLSLLYRLAANLPIRNKVPACRALLNLPLPMLSLQAIR